MNNLFNELLGQDTILMIRRATYVLLPKIGFLQLTSLLHSHVLILALDAAYLCLR